MHNKTKFASGVLSVAIITGVILTSVFSTYNATAQQSSVENATDNATDDTQINTPIVVPSGNDVMRLDTIVVGAVGEGESTESHSIVEKRTKVGSKTSVDISEIPQSVSVISQKQIQRENVIKVDEALRYTAGVLTQPFGSDSDTDWHFVRGFQSTQTGVYMDGLQRFGFGFGQMATESYLLERIEVLRGPASVLYGGSNPGGIINYVSKTADGEKRRITEAGINNKTTGWTAFDASDTITGNAFEGLDWRLIGRMEWGDDYSNFSDVEDGSIAGGFRYDLDTGTVINFMANYTEWDQKHSGGFLPYVGTVVEADFGRIKRDANFTESSLDEYDRKQGDIGLTIDHGFDNGWILSENLRYSEGDISEFQLYPFGYEGFALSPADSNNQLSRIVFSHDTEITTILSDTSLNGLINTGAVEHDILTGFDFNYFSMDQTQRSATGTTISATNPVYGIAQETPVAYLDQSLHQTKTGVYLQDQMRFGGGYIITLNGRYDDVDSRAAGNPSYSADDSEWSWRAGAAYQFEEGILKGLTPYYSSASFFNPLLGTSSQGALKPEDGEQHEIGLKYEPTAFNGLFTLSMFNIERENVVTGAFLEETQLGEVKSQGIEFEGQAELTENIDMYVASTFMDVDIRKDADSSLIGNRPNIIPEKQTSLALDYNFDGALDGFYVGMGWRYIGSSYADNANQFKVPHVNLYDARAGYEKNNLGINLSVSNLTNRKYVSSCNTEFACYYGEEIAFSASIRYDWK